MKGAIVVISVFFVVLLIFLGAVFWWISANGITIRVQHDVKLDIDDDFEAILENANIDFPTEEEIQDIVIRRLELWNNKITP